MNIYTNLILCLTKYWKKLAIFSVVNPFSDSSKGAKAKLPPLKWRSRFLKPFRPKVAAPAPPLLVIWAARFPSDMDISRILEPGESIIEERLDEVVGRSISNILYFTNHITLFNFQLICNGSSSKFFLASTCFFFRNTFFHIEAFYLWPPTFLCL